MTTITKNTIHGVSLNNIHLDDGNLYLLGLVSKRSNTIQKEANAGHLGNFHKCYDAFTGNTAIQTNGDKNTLVTDVRNVKSTDKVRIVLPEDTADFSNATTLSAFLNEISPIVVQQTENKSTQDYDEPANSTPKYNLEGVFSFTDDVASFELTDISTV